MRIAVFFVVSVVIAFVVAYVVGVWLLPSLGIGPGWARSLITAAVATVVILLLYARMIGNRGSFGRR